MSLSHKNNKFKEAEMSENVLEDTDRDVEE